MDRGWNNAFKETLKGLFITLSITAMLLVLATCNGWVNWPNKNSSLTTTQRSGVSNIETNIADQLRTSKIGDLVLFKDGRLLLITNVSNDWVTLLNNRCESQTPMPNQIDEVAKKVTAVIGNNQKEYGQRANQFLSCG